SAYKSILASLSARSTARLACADVTGGHFRWGFPGHENAGRERGGRAAPHERAESSEPRARGEAAGRSGGKEVAVSARPDRKPARPPAGGGRRADAIPQRPEPAGRNDCPAPHRRPDGRGPDPDRRPGAG